MDIHSHPTVEHWRERAIMAEAEIELLRQALQPFADYADQGSSFPDEFKITFGSRLAKRQLTIGDCRIARDVLTK
jgi:hypothetical protein